MKRINAELMRGIGKLVYEADRVVSTGKVDKFYELLGKITNRKHENETQLSLGQHLLYFNRSKGDLSNDGYYTDEQPSVLSGYELFTFKRRVWGGSIIQQYEPIRYGCSYHAKMTISSVRRLRSSVFVNLDLSVSNADLCLRELRTMVYTNTPPTRVEHLTTADEPQIIAQFRFTSSDIRKYSQLTVNPHRIHWDKLYCTNIEGYSDIIVQGPFAIQVLSSFLPQSASVQFKNVNYIYPNESIELCSNYNRSMYWLRNQDNPELLYLTAHLL